MPANKIYSKREKQKASKKGYDKGEGEINRKREKEQILHYQSKPVLPRAKGVPSVQRTIIGPRRE